MRFFAVTVSCALLLHCFVHSVDPDVDSPWPFGEEPLDQQPAISLPTLYHELRNQSSEWMVWQLVRMFTAAGDGDEFYHLERDLGDHYRRAAQVAMRMLLQFPTLAQTETLLNRALVEAAAELRNTTHLRHPLELLFDQLEAPLRQSANLSAAYNRLAEELPVLTTPPKRYFSRVLNAEAGYFPVKPNYVEIPGNLQLILRDGFREKLRKRGNAYGEYVLANAIYRLGCAEEHADQVEQIREKVASEMVPLMLEKKLVPFFFDPSWFVEEMLRRLERALNEQPQLRRQLLEQKQAIELENETENLAANNSSKRKYSFFVKSHGNITT